jgi:uncharacterized protein (DUF885 family)
MQSFIASRIVLSLRKETESALGPTFEQKKFHDFILSQGLLPPDLLQRAVQKDFIKPLQCESAAERFAQ